MNTSPKAGVHSHLSPRPPVTRDALQFSWQFRPAGKDKTVWSFLPRGHRPLPGKNLKYLRCTDTAYSGKAVAAGLSDHRRTQQEWMHQAVYARNNSLKILIVKGPSGPGVDGKQILILPAGNYKQTKVAHPRSRGTGGKVTVSTTAGRCSPEPSPGDLWFFPSLERTRFNACAAAAPNRSPDTPTRPDWDHSGDRCPCRDTGAG